MGIATLSLVTNKKDDTLVSSNYHDCHCYYCYYRCYYGLHLIIYHDFKTRSLKNEMHGCCLVM